MTRKGWDDGNAMKKGLTAKEVVHMRGDIGQG